MSSDVSGHAHKRTRQRVTGKQSKRNTQALLTWLWARGRDATDDDFAEFSTVRLTGRDYRVVQRGYVRYLVVRGKENGRFITIMRK